MPDSGAGEMSGSNSGLAWHESRQDGAQPTLPISHATDPASSDMYPSSEAASEDHLRSISGQSKPAVKQYVAPAGRHKRATRRHDDETSDDEPLVDKTAALTLNSKKTARQQKCVAKRRVQTSVQTLLDLPHEILTNVLSFLKPSDIFVLLRVSHAVHDLLLENELAISLEIIARRYSLIAQCFPLPRLLVSVPKEAHPALLSGRWQQFMRIHRFSYQQISQPADHLNVCSCTSCILSWNNLNIVLDLAHWQHKLANREPLPIMARGEVTEWNVNLLAKHARILEQAMDHPLTYAAILQKHLDTTTSTILRSSRWRRKGEDPSVVKPRLYGMTDVEAASGSDAFLARKGRENFNPIYMRDQYYSLEVWMPNRKWDREEERWRYYAKPQHDNDVKYVAERFTPAE